MPKRIQRKRTKGWRMPEGAVYVGRPTKWGNLFVIAPNETREEAIADYGDWIRSFPESVKTAQLQLRGKDLACWCPLDQSCHADVLLEIANRTE